MKNFIIILLIILGVFIYVNRHSDIDYMEKIRNFPHEIVTFIENMRDPEKRAMISEKLSQQVERVENKIAAVNLGTQERPTTADDKYVSLTLTNGLVAEGQLLQRTSMGDFVIQLPGRKVTIAKEEVSEVSYIEGEAAVALRELIDQTAIDVAKATAGTAAAQKTNLSLGLVHRWESSLPSALAKAKRENKLVMVEFSTTWCGWCKKLDKDTMKNAKVQAVLNKFFVSVRIDGDKNKDLVRQYQVRGYPNIVFMTSNSDVIMKQPGYLPPDRFMELLYMIVQKFAQPAAA